ncbi:hypothetical protein B0T10DRAFT_493116 [Thelonectria olida]|uniref:Zn(2)-C6 fungal-type domain-containing protein n=1 Tax=Thelonectria olida TaxID=1576542 RepID=A0A9P8W1M1_9HYPO|nr:hypothetical protein B0T10DRAFT_493116 [Thelonectria olida]
MASRSDQACNACKKQKRRCDKGLPECSLCRRTKRLCEYGIAADPQPTASDWGFLQARLTELENRLADSPRAVEQSLFPNPASAPVSGPALTSSNTLCESLDTHSPGPSSVTSSFRFVGATPAFSMVEDPGPNYGAQFPASMFLDVDCYVWSRVRLPAPRGPIPTPVLSLLSQGNVVLDVSRDYFATVHTWFPMVSKKRMDMGLPVQNAGPDLAMLFLGMKLVTAPGTDATDCALYTTAKSFLAHLESNGAVSLLCLQAMVLIALYEYGHAIYPAAWMSIGSCARYSDVLGLTPGDHPILGQATTWTEAEERRRVWWSISILDKLVSMGSRRRCLVPDPQPEGRLPVDDEAWDCGEVGKALGHSTCTPYQVEQSGFARLCQASIYLGRAIGYARGNPTMSTSRIAEIMSLAHELTGFGAIVDNESTARGLENRFPLLAPRSITRSALFVALERFTCPEKIGAEPGYVGSQGAKAQMELDLQRQSMQVIEQASEQLHTLSMDMLAMLRAEGDVAQPYSLGHVSPFIMDSIYAGAATFHWLLGESGKDVYRTAAADLDMFLDTLSSRWRLGSMYREMLSMHDVSARVEASTVLR